MKNLRKLGAAVVLTSVLALSAFAGETQTPPCVPGQIDTPPCASALGDADTPTWESTVPGDMGNGGASFTEIAADVLLNLLPLF
jgi:hypothetical protein